MYLSNLSPNKYYVNMDRLDMRFGMVCLLDKLGSKDDDNYFHKLKYVIKTAIEWGRNTNTSVGDKKIQYYILHFSDTLLIAGEIGEKKHEEIIFYIGFICNIIRIAMDYDVLYRGAISIGEFYIDVNEKNELDTSIFVGPAIKDAAQYMESSDIVGAILTKNASGYVRDLKLAEHFYPHTSVIGIKPLLFESKINIKHKREVQECPYCKYAISYTEERLMEVNWPFSIRINNSPFVETNWKDELKKYCDKNCNPESNKNKRDSITRKKGNLFRIFQLSAKYCTRVGGEFPKSYIISVP